MSKKNFKDNTSHLDRFFSEPSDTQRAHKPYGTDGAQETHVALPGTPPAGNSFANVRNKPGMGFPDIPLPPVDSPKQKYYRLNLKLKPEYKGYLAEASWAARKSITEYINDLIETDKATKDT